MPDRVIQIYKNINSNKVPEINLLDNLSQQALTNKTLINEAQKLFATNGVLTINNLFRADLISKLNQYFILSYQHYFTDKEFDHILDVGDKRKMLTVDFRSPFNTLEIYGNLFLMHLMRACLGENFVLGSFGAVVALPGAKSQHIHRDHPSLFDHEELDLKIPSFAITLVVPLIELTAKTGSTQVWKGSHKTSRSQKLDDKDSYIPYMPQGSCYLMDYQLLHGGTANLSNIVRPILYIVYYRSWFQESVNYEKQLKLNITPDEYLKVPQDYKFLFSRYRDSVKFSNHFKYYPCKQDSSPGFSQLSSTEQAKYLAEIAKSALSNYDFSHAQIKLISHGENTVFAVHISTNTENTESQLSQESSPYLSNYFILRVHRANYLSIDGIESELRWLHFLCHETDLGVPKPIANLEGKLYTIAKTLDLQEERVCSLTRYIQGHTASHLDFRQPSSINLEQCGYLISQLHHYAKNFDFPEGFSRPSWNWNGLFGDQAGYSDNGALIWELTPHPYRNIFESISRQVQKVMESLGEELEEFGLIHGDFWTGNLLVSGNTIHPIDFADCGFGYWGYDLARFLSDFSTEQEFEICLDRLLSGYTQVQDFPIRQINHLKLFIAAQHATFALWRINRSQDHPSFRATLTDDLEHAVQAIDRYLR